jgi:RNA-directed DNA polymerase
MEKIVDLTCEKLTSFLSIPIEIILELAEDAPFLYHKARIPKNDKGLRKLEIPHQILKCFQRQLLHKVFDKFQTHPCLYGGPKSSAKKAVYAHVRKPIVITMDIRNFFPSIKKHKVIDALNFFGVNKDLSIILARLVTSHNHLPQGAPTSPCIGRLVLNPFAYELDKMLKGIHPSSAFSIYFDDITISGPEGIKRIIPIVDKMLIRHGYELKKEKTQIMKKCDEQVSLNIRLNKKIEATNKFQAQIEELEKQLPPWNPKLLGKKAYVRYLSRPLC